MWPEILTWDNEQEQHQLKWSEWNLNPQSPDFKSGTLTTWPHCLHNNLIAGTLISLLFVPTGIKELKEKRVVIDLYFVHL